MGVTVDMLASLLLAFLMVAGAALLLLAEGFAIVILVKAWRGDIEVSTAVERLGAALSSVFLHAVIVIMATLGVTRFAWVLGDGWPRWVSFVNGG